VLSFIIAEKQENTELYTYKKQKNTKTNGKRKKISAETKQSYTPCGRTLGKLKFYFSETPKCSCLY
jgi:hypothetical protein